MANTTTQNWTEDYLYLNGSDTRNATKSHTPYSSSQFAFYLSICLLWIPGILSNILALFFIIRDIKKAIFPAIVLLFVLCTSDLTAVFFSLVRHMVKRYVHSANFGMCVSLSVLHTFFIIYAGVMNSLMAVDRVMAICTPFYYKRHVSVNTWKLACLIAAAVVATLNLLPLAGLGSYISYRRTGEMYCSTLGYKTRPVERIYGLTFGILGIAFIFTIVTLNIAVIRSVLRLNTRVVSFVPSESTISGAGKDGNSSKANTTSFEIAFAKLMLCLAAVYLFCGIPYYVVILLQQLNITVDRSLTGYIHFLAGFSYTVDPVVYILIRKTNRKRIVDFFCRTKTSNVTN